MKILFKYKLLILIAFATIVNIGFTDNITISGKNAITLEMINSHYLAGKEFRFSNSEIILGDLILGEDGFVEKYKNPNEMRWLFNDAEKILTIYRADGSVSCIYSDFKIQNNKLIIKGEYIPRISGHYHYLNEK